MSSQLLEALIRVKSDGIITLGEMADHLKEKALVIICPISIIPFMQPIPIPGLSTILGWIALFQGIGLLTTEKAFLTSKMKSVSLSPEKFEKIFRAAEKLSRFTEKLSLAPNSPVVQKTWNKKICGLWIIFLAALLSLPLPIPFSNFLPALGIFLICLSLLENDLILNIIGHAIGFILLAMTYFLGSFAMDEITNKIPFMN